mgnify:CR=1 FL=1
MAEDAPLATLTFEGGRTGLHFERVLHHPIERVWQALTSSEDLRHWMPADLEGELAKDAEISLPFWPEVVEKYQIADPVTSGRVERWEPPRAFGWTWDTDELLFELEPLEPLGELGEGGGGDDGRSGTKLVLSTWPGDDSPEMLVGTAAGWHACLDLLAERLDTGEGRSTVEVDPAPLEERYAEHLAF